MSIKLTNIEIDIIKSTITSKSSLSINNIKSIEDINAMNKAEILLLIDRLTDLIGYDKVKDDIDDLGRIADEIISKLINLLISRNEFD